MQEFHAGNPIKATANCQPRYNWLGLRREIMQCTWTPTSTPLISHESAADIGHHSDVQQWSKNRRHGGFGPLAEKRAVRISHHSRRLDRRNSGAYARVRLRLAMSLCESRGHLHS